MVTSRMKTIQSIFVVAACLVLLYIIHVDVNMDMDVVSVKKVSRLPIRSPGLVCPIPTLSNRTLPLTALASFPGSGNTWMRHLLQQLTGVLTGSIYRDGALRWSGFPAEGITNSSVVAIKTHCGQPTGHKYERAILVIRNPYEAFLAEFTRQKSKSHTGKISVFQFRDWSITVASFIKRYNNFHSHWAHHKDILLVFYDNLKANITQELIRISSFLKIAGVEGNLLCALRNSEGNFHRRSSGMPTRFFYRQRDMKIINDLISNVTSVLSKRFVFNTDIMTKWKMDLGQ